MSRRDTDAVIDRVYEQEVIMDQNKREQFTETVSDFIRTVSIVLPADIYGKFMELMRHEKIPSAAACYHNMHKNMYHARTMCRPVCQDTGVIEFFVSVGTGFPCMDEIEGVLHDAVVKATAEVPLRPNAVEPLGEHNTGTNAGFGAPYIEYDLVPGSSDLEIRMYMSGGGSSLPSRSRVLMPLEGREGIKRYIKETVLEWGINACPPLILGIGLGTDASTSAALSKKALLRPVGTHSEYPEVKKLEIELRDELDEIGIAPLGFGGSYSVLGVNIECAAHHPATLGVGISTGCWATRRGHIVIHEDLSSKNLSHIVFPENSHEKIAENTHNI